MSEELSTVLTSKPQEEAYLPGPNDSFHNWFLKHAWRFIGSALIAAFSGYALSFIKEIDKGKAFGRLSLAQFLFLFVSIFFFARVKRPKINIEEESFKQLGYNEKTWKEAKDHAEKSVSQFRHAWLWALACWSVLYLIFYLQSRIAPNPTDIHWITFTTIADLLNIGSNTALLACYLILAERTTGTENSPFMWLFSIILIGIIELVLVLTFSSDPTLDPARKLTVIIFGAMVGVVGGIVLGLLVGQLDSHHLDAPVWLLALLFSYAAIQPLYPVLQGVLVAFGQVEPTANPNFPFETWEKIQVYSPAIIIGIAGIFKLLICVFLYYSFYSGRLLFYCARTRTIADSVDKDWTIFKKTLTTSARL